ncbi:MAG: DUF2079 domain-containing protein [Burkholderiales bacterium]
MLLLDILIGTLVVYPWLTDWAWIEIPGYDRVQLSDFGLPLLVAALVVLALRHWRRIFQIREWTKSVRGVCESLWRTRRRTLSYAAGIAGALVLAILLWRRVPDTLGFNTGLAIWELTRGMGGVALVAFVAMAVRRCSRAPWENSFFVRLGARIGRAWLAALDRSPARALWLAAGAVAAVFLWTSLLRHRAFQTHGYDLGIFTNAIWNLTHGNGYISSVKGGINLFADHQSPVFWLLAPLFWAVPRPETLLFIQAVGLAAGGPALFYLARARFGRGHWAPAALPWIYWTYLPLRNANAFDFHPEVFMLPLFLWAFAAFASKRGWIRALGVLALVCAFGTKESAGVVAAGIGLAWALASRARPWRARWLGIALAVVGAALFLYDIKVVPRMFGGDYQYMGLYDRFGGGIVDVVLAPFVQPRYFLSQILDGARLNFLFWTLAPLGFLPLFEWRAALAALPPYLMLFLSEGDQRVRMVFHYGIEPGTALFWALPFGMAAFARRFGWRRTGIWMLFWSVACLGPSEMMRARDYAQTPHAHWLATEVIPCLNQDAATAASDTLVPHLSTRAWISYPDKLRQLPSGDPVSCVVTDLQISNWPLGRDGVERVLAGLPGKGYHRAWSCREFSVYELGNSQCLRCTPDCP